MQRASLDEQFLRFRDQGDGAALAAVFDGTARDLLRLAGHLVPDQAEAEDVVQSTFLTAIRRAERYEPSAPVQAWLYGILWREAARSRRRGARRVEPERLHERAAAKPEETLAAGEVGERVGQALARLPGRYREVLEPFVRGGERPEEIARRLGRTPGTVRSQLSRGLERLRRALPPSLAPTWGVVGFGRLDAIRGSVLEAAGIRPEAAAGPAGGPALPSQLVLGSAVTAKLALGATLAAALGLVAWFGLDSGPTGPTGDRGERRMTSAEAGAPVQTTEADATRPGTAATPGAPRLAAVAQVAEPAAASPEDPLAYWLARFAEHPDDWRHGWSVAEEIAALPPDEALEVMRGVWPALTTPVKEQVLKPFVFQGGHPHALAVLDLAVRDGAPTVQARAFSYLTDYAFRDFADDFGAYVAWAARYRDRPVAEVLAANADALVARLLAAEPDELARATRELERFDFRNGTAAGLDLAARIREAGGLALLDAGLTHADPEVRACMFTWAADLGVGDEWFQRTTLPLVTAPVGVDPAVLHAAIRAMGHPTHAWAREPLLDAIERRGDHGVELVRAASRALAQMDDSTVIPRLIRLLGQDTRGELTYDVGYFGLSELTGVDFEEDHDGAWWLDWWERNNLRYPPDARAIPVQ